MNLLRRKSIWVLPGILSLYFPFHAAHAQDQGKTSYIGSPKLWPALKSMT